jgi:hypothetical protein
MNVSDSIKFPNKFMCKCGYKKEKWKEHFSEVHTENKRLPEYSFITLIWTEKDKFLKFAFEYQRKMHRKKYGTII